MKKFNCQFRNLGIEELNSKIPKSLNSPILSDSSGFGTPDDLLKLEVEPNGKVVFENPLGERPGSK